MSTQLQAVVLDLDGLLVDTERVVRDAWADTAEEAGFSVPPRLVQSMVGHRAPDIRAILAAHFGSDATAHRLLDRSKFHIDVRLRSGAATVKPGASEFLELLDELGLPRALATSSLRDRLELKAGESGLLERMDAILCGDEVPRGKPSPDIYLAAAGALGAHPSACVAVEDSGPGIASAVAAGMHALLVPDHWEPAEETVALATAVFDDLHGCCSYVRAAVLG